MDKKRMKFLIGGLVIVAAIASLAFFAVRGNMVYYYTVTELQQKGASQNVQVSGNLVRGTIKEGQGLGDPITFQISDKDAADKVISVSFTGNVPDTFREPRPEDPVPEVVIKGDFRSDQSFDANFLLAKCPSKYEKAVQDEKAGQEAASKQ